MRRFLVLLLLAAALLLGGCAQQPHKAAVVYNMKDLRHWYEQQKWHFVGRLGVVSEHESFSANIDWRHEPQRDLIEMAGPWGVGRMRFVVDVGTVVVDDGEQVRTYHQSAAQVVGYYIGTNLPVDAFQFWVLGLVEPGKDYEDREQGFDQHGWRIVYRQMQAVNGGVLPRKVNMEKERTKVKLIVDKWKLL